MGILLLTIVSPKHGEGREAIYQLDMSLPALAHLAEPNRIAENTNSLGSASFSESAESDNPFYSTSGSLHDVI